VVETTRNYNQFQQAPRVLVVGTGAVGGYYGGKLAQAGARVAALCRSEFAQVKEKGISISSVGGDFTFMPEKVIGHLSEYAPPPDFMLVALKVLPQIDTANLIRESVGPETTIVLLQNGIHIEEPLVEAFPENEIISALAFICLSRPKPGHIEHSDYGRLVIGRFPQGSSTRTELLASLFNSVQVPCETTEDVITARWRKLVWNAAFNPLSVLAGGLDTLTMVQSPGAVQLARKIMNEVCQVAAADGYALPAEVVEQNIEGTQAMAPFKTSMLQDYEAGRPMEVEAILGNCLRTAQQHDVEVPYLESFYVLMKLVQEQRRYK